LNKNCCFTCDTVIDTVNGLFYVSELIGKEFSFIYKYGFISRGIKDVYIVEFKSGTILPQKIFF